MRKRGLKLAKLSNESRADLAGFVPPTGTSLRNPIDVGLTPFLQTEIYVRAARTAAQDPGVDAVVVIGIGMNREINRVYTESMIQATKEFEKPFIMINIPGFDPELAQRFCEAGVPFFETSERAMITYARVRRYQLWRRKMMKGEQQ